MAKKKKVYTLHEYRIITLRRATSRWKFKYDCLNAAKVYKKIGHYLNGNDKIGVFFKCAECLRNNVNKLYSKREVQVDHISPCVAPADGFVDWNTFIPNLLCDSSNLQVLCKPCHKVKTARENELRGKSRNKKKTLDKVRKSR